MTYRISYQDQFGLDTTDSAVNENPDLYSEMTVSDAFSVAAQFEAEAFFASGGSEYGCTTTGYTIAPDLD